MTYLRLVVAGGLGVEFCAVEDAAAFGIRCAEYDAADAGEGEGASAHGAGLQGDVQVVLRCAL